LRTLVTTSLQVQAVPIRVSWRKLMDSWNRENEDRWAYEDERRFYRDCNRTLRTIVRPYDGTSSPDRENYSSLEVTIPEDDAPRFIRRRGSTKVNTLGSSYETRGVRMIPAPEGGANVCDGEIISGGERRGCGY
jgi:hypothetical protein